MPSKNAQSNHNGNNNNVLRRGLYSSKHQCLKRQRKAMEMFQGLHSVFNSQFVPFQGPNILPLLVLQTYILSLSYIWHLFHKYLYTFHLCYLALSIRARTVLCNILSSLKMISSGAPKWGAQMVQHLPSAQVMLPGFWD